MSLNICPADLDAPDIVNLILAHRALMFEQSPPESCHVLPVDGLKSKNVTVWALYEGETLLGMGGLHELSDTAGEIKSMHTAKHARGRGLGKRMLEHILQEAKLRGYRDLMLETGSMEGFIPAQRLYAAYGFDFCEPFGDYVLDPNSVYMHLSLDPASV